MTNLKGSTSRYVLVALCVVVVLTTLALVVMNYWNKNSGISAIDQMLSGQTYEDGYKAGYLAAREKLSKVPIFTQNTEVQTVGGEIQSANTNDIKLLVDSLDTDPIVDGVSDIRTVHVDKDTKIVKQTILSEQDYNKRFETWRLNEAQKGTMPPLPYTETPIKLNELKTGMRISVTSNENIRLKESFLAKTIILSQSVSISIK